MPFVLIMKEMIYTIKSQKYKDIDQTFSMLRKPNIWQEVNIILK